MSQEKLTVNGAPTVDLRGLHIEPDPDPGSCCDACGSANGGRPLRSRHDEDGLWWLCGTCCRAWDAGDL